jgi:hypothetical protein
MAENCGRRRTARRLRPGFNRFVNWPVWDYRGWSQPGCHSVVRRVKGVSAEVEKIAVPTTARFRASDPYISSDKLQGREAR